MTQRLILASKSAARIALLTEAGLSFEAAPADLCEATLKAQRHAQGARPATLAQDLADAKAVEVSNRHPAALVIGADQTLDLDGVMFDKPVDRAQARSQLQSLRGRSHTLHSAVSLARDGSVQWRTLASATLSMRGFTDAFLDHYLGVEAAHIPHCVGAYRLEGYGVQLFDRIEGDYFTILGLPLLPLLQTLRALGEIPA